MAGNKIASSPLTAGGALYSLINTSYDLFCVQHGLTLGDMVNAAILTGAFCSGYGLVIGYGLNDGFRDANFIFEEVGLIGEKLGIDIGVWKADGLGPNLELPGGTPFNYAPSFIILPYF